MWKSIKKDWPYVLIVFTLYLGVYWFSSLLEPMTAKGLVVGNILIFTPVTLLLTSLHYAYRYGSFWFLWIVILCYPVTMVVFGEWIIIYHFLYSLMAVIGTVIGNIFYHKINNRNFP